MGASLLCFNWHRCTCHRHKLSGCLNSKPNCCSTIAICMACTCVVFLCTKWMTVFVMCLTPSVQACTLLQVVSEPQPLGSLLPLSLSMQPQQSVETKKPVKTSDLNHFSLVGWAGDVDMRNMQCGCCGQRPCMRSKDETKKGEKKRREKKEKKGRARERSYLYIHDP